MPGKSRKNAARQAAEKTKNIDTANNSGDKKAEKRKKKKEKKKGLSIGKSIRNGFIKMGRKRRGDSSVASSAVSVVSDFEEVEVFHPSSMSIAPPSPKATNAVLASLQSGSLKSVSPSRATSLATGRMAPAALETNQIIATAATTAINTKTKKVSSYRHTPLPAAGRDTPKKNRHIAKQQQEQSKFIVPRNTSPKKTRESPKSPRSPKSPKSPKSPRGKREKPKSVLPLQQFARQASPKNKTPTKKQSRKVKKTIQPDPLIESDDLVFEMRSSKSRKKTSSKKSSKKSKHSRHKHRQQPKSERSRKKFVSYSDSSDYSDTDFGSQSFGSEDSSSAYSDPGLRVMSSSYSDSDSRSESESDSDASFHSSDSSRSFDTAPDRVVRSSRKPQRRRQAGGHLHSPRSSKVKQECIRSPRSSRRKNDHHISSPRKHGKNKYYSSSDDDDDSSYDSRASYSSGVSYSRRGGDSYSGSSYSDSESGSGSGSDGRTVDSKSYYNTSYDEDTRHLRDASTFASSWTERQLSAYGSGETETVDTRSIDYRRKRSQKRHSILSKESSTRTFDKEDYDSRHYHCESRSMMTDSRDEIDEDEYSAFVKEQEAADMADEKIIKALAGLGIGNGGKKPKKCKKEPEDNASVFTWNFWGAKEEVEEDEHDDIVSPVSSQPTSSRKHLITRESENADMATMSSGSSTSLDQILGGDSMPGSYDGLGKGNSNKEEPRGKHHKFKEEEVMSVTLRGSGTFDDNGEKPQEIAFLPSCPVVSSPTRSKRPVFEIKSDIQVPVKTESGHHESLMVPDIEDGDNKSFLSWCWSPDNSARSQRAAGNDEDDGDGATFASTINTEAVNVLSPKTEASGEKDKTKCFTIPLKTQELSEDEADEVSSCAEKIQMELGPCSNSDSYGAADMIVGDEDEEDSMKRIKAEKLDDYDISEILHGRKAYKSKTDEDGLPIPVDRPMTPNERRERRMNAMKAHRDFLYKSRSLDTNEDAASKDIVEDIDEISCDEKSKATTVAMDSDEAMNKTESKKNSTASGGSNTAEPSLLSNSIVQEDGTVPNNEDKPDALIDLVRNAFSFMAPTSPTASCMSPTSQAASVKSPASPANEDTTASEAKEDAEKAIDTSEEGNKTSPISPSAAMDDMIGAASRFFFSDKKESSPLISEDVKKTENLICHGFNPNPMAKNQVTEAVDEDNVDTSSLPSKDDTNVTDEAVLKNSRSKMSSSLNPDTNIKDGHFNADGIPLTLKPNKIWRVFDSGFNASPSDVPMDTEIKEKSSIVDDGEMDMIIPDPIIEHKSPQSECEDPAKLAESARDKRRAQLKQQRMKNMRLNQERSNQEKSEEIQEDKIEGVSEPSPRVSVSPVKQRLSEESPVHKTQEEDCRDATIGTKDKIQEEQPKPDRISLSRVMANLSEATGIMANLSEVLPKMTPSSPTTNEDAHKAPASPTTNEDTQKQRNINEIRSRIRKRQRSRLRRQQQHYGKSAVWAPSPSSPTIASEKPKDTFSRRTFYMPSDRSPLPSERSPLPSDRSPLISPMSLADRRDDSSTSDNEDFFDAVTTFVDNDYVNSNSATDPPTSPIRDYRDLRH